MPVTPEDAAASSAPSRKWFESQWVRFAAKRMITLVVVFFVLMLVTFMMVRLVPGDPVITVVGLDAPPETVERVREQLGLNDSVPTQFIAYVGDVFRGDLGDSFVTGRAVSDLVSQRIAVSARLAAFALATVMLVSIPVGMIAAVRTRNDRHPRLEAGFTATTSLVGAFPEFLMATLLAAFFGVWLQWLPVASLRGWESYILPVAAIAMRPTFTLARIVRLETLNVLSQDYIRTAESKRLSPRRVYLRHALPNSVTSALTIGGLLFAGLISGTVLVESVFALPGLGTALVSAVKGNDYPVVQGIVLVLGVAVVLVNTVVDVILAMLDPRSLAREA